VALTEAATRLADRPDPVPAGLVLAIAGIDAWNRINATTRQITGDWVDQWVAQAA
jgi:hypothetical protein